jgi:ABC-type nickel/cobalt efflux system permease component RcnA
VPRDNHDRTILVRLTPDALLVDYRLELDESRAALDLPRSEAAGVTSRQEFYAAVLRYYGGALAGNLDAALDGKPLDFTCVGSACQVTDHLRCDFRFRAAWRPAADVPHAFRFREANFELDDFSVLRLTLAAGGGVLLRDAAAPDAALVARPGSERRPGDGERLRRASATFTLVPEEPRAASKPALPPDADAREAPGLLAGRVAAARARPAEAVAWDKPGPGPAAAEAAAGAAERPGPAESPGGPRTPLHVLLDTRQGVGMMMLVMAGLGAAHALTPGHGKTLVAAYLVGERGTAWHALLLGVVTTLTHTAVVFALSVALALSLPEVAPANVSAALGFVGGLLVAGLGLWLLLVRLSGRPDHIHIGGGHHHHGHAHAAPLRAAGWGGLVVLGISGGIVPCGEALVIPGWAAANQRAWLGPPLVLAFSAGLAGVLVALGLSVVYARNFAGARWGGWDRLRPLVRALPLVSAAVITTLGLWLCYDSLPRP